MTSTFFQFLQSIGVESRSPGYTFSLVHISNPPMGADTFLLWFIARFCFTESFSRKPCNFEQRVTVNKHNFSDKRWQLYSPCSVDVQSADIEAIVRRRRDGVRIFNGHHLEAEVEGVDGNLVLPCVVLQRPCGAEGGSASIRTHGSMTTSYRNKRG